MCFASGEKQMKFEEILPIYAEVIKIKDTGTFADFNEAFKTFDREGQGLISVAELRQVLTSLGQYYLSCSSQITCVHMTNSAGISWEFVLRYAYIYKIH